MISKYLPPTKIYVKTSIGKGLGVFAKENIQKGEVFETCPLYNIGIKRGEEHNLFLNDYRFCYPVSLDFEYYVIPWGYGCLYNHSDTPNSDWKQHPTEFAFEFYSIKDIKAGEEIYTWYGGEDYWKTRKTKT